MLQTVCSFITDETNGTGHAEAVTRYCEAIRAAGGEPVFYEMGWGKGDREAEGRKRIIELAVKNKLRFYAPCSTAWARVYKEKPDLDAPASEGQRASGRPRPFPESRLFLRRADRRKPRRQVAAHLSRLAARPAETTDGRGESGRGGGIGEVPARRLSGEAGEVDVSQYGCPSHEYARRSDGEVSGNRRVGGAPAMQRQLKEATKQP